MTKNIFNYFFILLIVLSCLFEGSKGAIKKRQTRTGKTYYAPITNFYDQAYTINVQIGSPPQNFNVLLSTASSDYWVLDCSLKLQRHQTFDLTKSKTYRKTNKVLNLPSVGGTVGCDNIQFSGIRLNQAEFARANDIDQATLDQPFDGIMGMGYPGLSNAGITPPIMLAMRQNLLTNKMFTLYLKGGYGSEKGNMPGGMATFGDVDKQNCDSKINWIKLSQPLEHYQFKIDGIKFQGRNYGGSEQAISDSSTSIIFGNQRVTNDLANKIGARWNNDVGVYFLPCNKKIDPITIKIAGNDYVLTQEVLIFNFNSTHCAFSILPIDPQVAADGYQWILGSPFIRKYCHTYDIGQSRLGLSKVTK